MAVGANDPLSERRIFRGTQYKIKSFKVHDKYDKDTRAAYYDIAIVELTKEIKFKKNVWPICIPERIDKNQNKFGKQSIKVIGYGPMKTDDGKLRSGEIFLDLHYTKKLIHKKVIR